MVRKLQTRRLRRLRRLLVVGCGDVMRRMLPELVRRWRVVALVRQRDPQLTALGVVQIEGDLDRPRSLRRLAAIAGSADAAIHSAPPPPDSADSHAGSHFDRRTRNLIAALQRGESLPRALAYIGTSGVYGDCSGECVAETRRLAPQSARAKRRVDAETRLRRLGRTGACRVMLLRAPGIYAADRLPLQRLQQGLPLIRAAEDVFTNHIHAEDLGRACMAALRYGRANRCYNASDDSVLRMGEWFDFLADAYGLPRAPRLPRVEVRAQVSALQWSFMGESRRLDNRRLHRELKFRFLYPTVMDCLGARKVGRYALD